MQGHCTALHVGDTIPQRTWYSTTAVMPICVDCRSVFHAFMHGEAGCDGWSPRFSMCLLMSLFSGFAWARQSFAIWFELRIVPMLLRTWFIHARDNELSSSLPHSWWKTLQLCIPASINPHKFLFVVSWINIGPCRLHNLCKLCVENVTVGRSSFHSYITCLTPALVIPPV